MNKKQVNKILKKIKKEVEQAWDNNEKITCGDNSYITCELPLEAVYIDFTVNATGDDIKTLKF